MASSDSRTCSSTTGRGTIGGTSVGVVANPGGRRRVRSAAISLPSSSVTATRHSAAHSWRAKFRANGAWTTP